MRSCGSSLFRHPDNAGLRSTEGEDPPERLARGIIEAYEILQPTVPFVVRLDGTNDVEARKLLADANLPHVYAEATMDSAAARVVELARSAEGASAP